MELCFITKYLAGNYDAILRELHIVLVPIGAVFIAMSVDFLFAIRKARLNGIMRSSFGFRRSVIKFIEYYSAMLIAFTLDVVASISESINLPYLTFVFAAFLIFIEAKSIRENIFGKKRIKDQNKDIQMLVSALKNKDNLIKAVLEILENESGDEQKQEEEDYQNGKG